MKLENSKCVLFIVIPFQDNFVENINVINQKKNSSLFGLCQFQKFDRQVLTITSNIMSGNRLLISSGDAIHLQQALEKMPQKKSKSKKSKNGPVLLHYAVKENQKECCIVLLDQGRDVNEKEPKTGYTPLHHAAENVCFFEWNIYVNILV